MDDTKKDGVLNNFDILLSETINWISKNSNCKRFINQYGEYTFMDLVMLCKIDRLMELSIISSSTHRALVKLYKERIELDKKFFESSDSKESEKLYKKLVEISEVLEKYNLLPSRMGFIGYLDKLIFLEKYDGLAEEKLIVDLSSFEIIDFNNYKKR